MVAWCPAALMNALRVGVDFHAFPNWIIAGSNITRAATVKKFHGTQPAHAGRLQRFVVAKGRYVDTEFFRYLEDVLSLFALDFFAIEFKSYHFCFPFRR